VIGYDAVRLLVVEDSERLRRAICVALRASAYAVDEAARGDDAGWLLEANRYDAVVLDIMLPGEDGLSVLERLRRRGDGTHVLLLTARDAVEDRVKGLRAGADDYLVKPFAIEELIARVEALTRRAYGQKSPVLRIGELEIDTQGRTVHNAGAAVALTAREYAVLEYLARRRGQVVTRTEIEAHVYDQNAEPMSNVVDAAIYGLRRKLDRPGRESLIQTRRGMGYVLEAEATTCPRSVGE
jgi:DNA-binding response OmpR family regulator